MRSDKEKKSGKESQYEVRRNEKKNFQQKG